MRVAQLPTCSRQRQHRSTRVSQSPRLLLPGAINTWPLLKVTSMIMACGSMELTSRGGVCRHLLLRLPRSRFMAMVKNPMAMVSVRLTTVHRQMGLILVRCSRLNRWRLQTMGAILSHILLLSSWFRRHTTLPKGPLKSSYRLNCLGLQDSRYKTASGATTIPLRQLLEPNGPTGHSEMNLCTPRAWTMCEKFAQSGLTILSSLCHTAGLICRYIIRGPPCRASLLLCCS